MPPVALSASSTHPASDPFPFRTLLVLSVGLLLAACSGGDGGGSQSPNTPPSPTAPVAPSPVPSGILAISASGLPDGVQLQATVVGPIPGSTFSRTTTGPVTWTDIPSGRYSVAVRNTRGVTGTFTGAPSALEVDVPAGGPPSQAVLYYRAMPSTLALEISGLPASTNASVTVTPPNGVPSLVSQSSLHTAPQLATGKYTPDTWRIAADTVLVDGTRYAPSRMSLDTVVAFGDTARVQVRYGIATGSLAVVVTGLPATLAGDVLVISPDQRTQSLERTTTLTGLEPGRYRLVGRTVAQQSISYRAAVDTIAVDVVASLTAAPATITYVAQVGALALTTQGLPASAQSIVTLSGNGIARALTVASASTVFADSLPPGTYTLTTASVTAEGDRYAPTLASHQVTVSSGASTPVTIIYALASGSLSLTLRGLPDGTLGDVQLAGPNNFQRTLHGSGTVSGLLPGRYTLSARTVQVGGESFGVVPGDRTVDIAAERTPVDVSLRYVSLPAIIDIPVTGLPAGYNAAISLTGPSGEHYSIIASQQLSPVTPGRWRLTASPVSTALGVFVPSPASRDSIARAGETLSYGVHYSINTGALALAVVGLPPGVAGAITINGPAGFSRITTGTSTFTGLAAGSYSVSATSVTVGQTKIGRAHV